MKINYIVRVSFIALLLTILQSIFAWIFGLPAGMTYFITDIIAILLVVLVLSIYVSNSVLRGWKLIAATFIIYSAIGNINIHIEAIVFGVTDKNETLFFVLIGLISNLTAAFLVTAFIEKSKEEPVQTDFIDRGIFSWTWRIILGAFAYFFIYIAAGLLLSVLYPQVIEFYGDKIPPFDLIAITQIPRSIIFVGIAILILRTVNLTLFKTSILIGLVFSVFGAIAPLIPPNEFMPGYVRLGHGFEVGLSNLLYGVFLGYLLSQGVEKLDVTQEGIP